MKKPKNTVNYCGLSKSVFLRPPFWSFHNASCKIHDKNYAKGGKVMDRLTADIGFLWRMCRDANRQKTVHKKKKAIYSALAYFILVRIFGWIAFKWK